LKNRLIIITALEIVSLLVLATIYYYGFDLQSGLNPAALTWGLPLGLAIIAVLVTGFLTWKGRSIKWGLGGLGFSMIVMAYFVIIASSYYYLLVISRAGSSQQDSMENKILGEVISENVANNKFVIIDPVTEVPELNIVEVQLILSPRSDDLMTLVNRFITINKISSQLSLNSSPRAGYYVDYGSEYKKYFKNLAEGWRMWRVFHPYISGCYRISQPYYDPESGYFLLFMDYTKNTIFRPGGFGNLYIYKYENNSPKLVETVPISIK
jgi:hypothetical protein